MTDRNCWKCRYNDAKNYCTYDDDAGYDVDSWAGENADPVTLMPPPETPTACPGFDEAPNV